MSNHQICDVVFEQGPDGKDKYPVKTWEDIPDKEALETLPNGMKNPLFLSIVSMIIGHELKHARPLLLKDVDDPHSYQWVDVVDKIRPATFNNVNNHLFLDILSELERRHIKLVDDLDEQRDGKLERKDEIS